MRVLFHSIIHMERYFESFQTSLIHVITYLLNDQPTRKYIDLNELGVCDISNIQKRRYRWQSFKIFILCIFIII